MIKHHPQDRSERRRLKEIHEKTERFRKRAKEALKYAETEDELNAGRAGLIETD